MMSILKANKLMFRVPGLGFAEIFGRFLAFQGRFPYWYSDELQCSSWPRAQRSSLDSQFHWLFEDLRNDPANDWNEQVEFSRRR